MRKEQDRLPSGKRMALSVGSAPERCGRRSPVRETQADRTYDHKSNPPLRQPGDVMARAADGLYLIPMPAGESKAAVASSLPGTPER